MTEAASAQTEQPPEESRFFDSMFDVFGVTSDRRAENPSRVSGTIRQASANKLETPTARNQGERSADPSKANSARTLQSVYWQEELDKLVALLETQLDHQEVGETPREQDYYLRQHVALRLLYLIGSRRPEALQSIPYNDPAQQEFWTEMLWALSNFFDDEVLPDRSERARETVERLRAALAHIEPEAGLHLTHALFCQQIDGFGNYATFEADEFTPGQSVLIYAEVENFGNQATSQGDYLTKLQSTIDIRKDGASGPIVFHNELAPTEDRCRSRRRDYFHSYRIKLPTTLTPGPHVLSLTIRDEISHKLSTTTLHFTVR